MGVELNKSDLIDFILRHRSEMSADKLKRSNITQLVMIKTKIEVEQFKTQKY